MLPPKLKELRRALSQAQPRTGRETPPPNARRCAEALELARGAERAAADGRFTPAEFWAIYGYSPKAATRMREIAEHLAYSGGGGGDRD